MAAKLLYLLSGTASGASHGAMQEGGSAPAASTLPTGWTVAKNGAALFKIMLVGSENTGFAAGALPGTGGPGTTDAFRSPNTIRGTFANANWTIAVAVRAVTTAATGTGRLNFRVWRTASATGASATQIGSALLTTGNYSNLLTTADQNLSVVFNPGAVSLVNEYLFFTVACETVTASGSNTADCLIRLGGSSLVTTADFTNDYIMVAASGSYALSGAAAGLGSTLPAANAAYALTGSVTLLGVKVPVAVGSFALSGAAAGLAKASRLSATVGALILAGANAGLAHGTRLVVATGAFVYSANAAILSVTAPAAAASFSLSAAAASLDVTMPAASGSLALSGATAGLAAQRKIVVSAGALALSGSAVVLGVAMPAASASLALTGATANAVAQRRMACVSATFLETGSPAGLTKQSVVVAGSGAYALSGAAAALAVRLPVGSGSFILAGADAVATKANLLAVSGGSFALSGAAAGLSASRVLAAGSGSFALTGISAGLGVGAPASGAFFALTGSATGLGVGAPAASGSFAMTGSSAGLGVGVLPASGSFALSGADAGLAPARRLAADVGSFAWSGADADLAYAPVLGGGHFLLTAARGAFALSGAGVGLRRGRVLAAGPGSLALSGASAGATRSLAMAAGSGHFVTAGASAGLGHGLHLPAVVVVGRVLPLVVIAVHPVAELVRIESRVYPEDVTMGLVVGAVAVVPAVIKVLGVKTDPGALQILVTDPEGDAATYALGTDPEVEQVTRGAVPVVGEYRARIPCTKPGKWTFLWTVSGATDGVQDGDFDVEAPNA